VCIIIIIIIIIIKLENTHFVLQNAKHMLSFHVQFLAGDVLRGCAALPDFSPNFQQKELKELQNSLAARQAKEIIYSFCNDRDLCNGSSRLAEISTMMILLPASLVLLISFFSRL